MNQGNTHSQSIRNCVKVIESDHHSLIGTQKMKTKNLKNEMFNFKDEEGQKAYKEMA